MRPLMVAFAQLPRLFALDLVGRRRATGLEQRPRMICWAGPAER